jgi:hypothetical protein
MSEPLRLSPASRSHAALGAVFETEAAWQLPASYGDEAGEAELLRGAVAIVDVTARGKIDVRDAASFTKRLQEATREDRQRTSVKEKREWPRRVNHKPQKPPNFLKLSRHEKALAHKLLATATIWTN